jgi:hypothetical protein
LYRLGVLLSGTEPLKGGPKSFDGGYKEVYATKKTSIFLRDDVHRKLKVVAAERDTSIQKLMENAAESILLPRPAPESPGSGLSLAEKSDLAIRFRKILDSDDPMVVLNCQATVDAMEVWIERRKTQAPPVTLPAPLAPTPLPAVKRRPGKQTG